MFFIKFEGKIENVRGNAENIFNFTQEFNEKHWNPHFFLVKNKKPVEIFFGRITNYWTLLFEISTFFLDMRRFQMYHIYI